MTNLEPKVNTIYGRNRAQLAEFMAGDTPEAFEVEAVVAETVKEYPFLDTIARATENSEGYNFEAYRVYDDLEKVIQFAAWRALVNQSRMRQKPVIEGDPRLVPKAVPDGKGGYKLIRPDRNQDPTIARIEDHGESDEIQADIGEHDD